MVLSNSINFLFLLLLLYSPSICSAIRSLPNDAVSQLELKDIFGFSEAPEYRNGVECTDTSAIHVTTTLDSEYLRGSMALVHSILRHATCPERVYLHFIAGEFDAASPRVLTKLVRSIFPSLNFRVHVFREDRVINMISSSIRSALENPLNYARNYLGELLEPEVNRVVYLDSDVVLVDDVEKLWKVKLTGGRVVGAPEYCAANFTNYFNSNFWSDSNLSSVFNSRSKQACYFNTGVMVIDLKRWREGHFREKLENWMELQRRNRIYELGSLPPFLLVFGGDVEPIDHRWNQHGLGGDNVYGSCRSLHPGPVSLLHWSGKGKPWVRLDERRACAVDHLWEPYDLYWKKGKKVQEVKREVQQWNWISSYLF